MGMITIEKYVEGRCVEKMSLPVAPLRFLANLLPRKAKFELLALGLDVDTILAASRTSPAECWVDVEENTVPKRVRVVRHA
ncbi:hypothetical protein [Agrobacterium tumefaciens]|uniref:Uncharacterized protein n=1 Tax=Agrobacterium tumefaciens TaxID=358 RepID=A0A176XCN7_AGRTU|nr:hypothetical protein [Agrobacterium tumefaciens]OAE45650.1 hypothetical protein A7J57_16725 [Agrobacterium tumefaciens]